MSKITFVMTRGDISCLKQLNQMSTESSYQGGFMSLIAGNLEHCHNALVCY